MTTRPQKVCVVTGSSSGIGAATARLYAQNGWRVVINYSRNPAPAEAVASECRAFGVDVLVIKGDVSNDADCRRIAAEVEAQWGRTDVLVNNAGTTKFVPLKDLEGLSAEDFHAIYDVNVIGAYQMVRAFAPLMKKTPGGAVVNMSSVASMMGRGSCIAYMASKGALNAVTVGLARALGPEIRVNAIAPGFVETPWLESGLGAYYDKSKQAYIDVAALEAVIQPEDVAATAWYLGASAAKTTGEVLLVDAGLRVTKG
jgi:NAD(P)-dependent dehydrogenase (short-subunit alcohol dehydrogenase family)